jgi:hypothetical protein
MANVSDFRDQIQGASLQASGGFPYRGATLADQEVLVARALNFGDGSPETDQGERMSVLGAGVTVSLASVLCWGALAGGILALL